MARMNAFTEEVEWNIWNGDSSLNYLCDIEAISMYDRFCVS